MTTNLFAVDSVKAHYLDSRGNLPLSVQLRGRDFGVRRALGATTVDVLSLVVTSAVRVIGSGAVVGLVLAAFLGRLLTTMLFGVKPLDLPTFAFVTVVLGVTATISVGRPAWWATRIDPAAALRSK